MNKSYKQFIESLNQDEADKISREKYLEELQKLKEEDVVVFNSIREKDFVEGLCALIEEFNNRLYKRAAINEMSFRLDLSPVSIKRYMDKHTTTQASFEVVNGMIKCKKHLHERKPEIKIIKRPNLN